MKVRRQIVRGYQVKAIDLLMSSNGKWSLVNDDKVGEVFEMNEDQFKILQAEGIKMRIVRTFPKKKKKGTGLNNNTTTSSTTSFAQDKTTTWMMARNENDYYGECYI